jgi:hypothetical protein
MIDGYDARHKLKEARHMLQYKVNLTGHRLLHNPLILPMHILKLKFLVYIKRITSHCTYDRQQAYQKRQYMWHKRRRNYSDFVLKHCKYENTDSSSAEGRTVPTNFKASDDTVAW